MLPLFSLLSACGVFQAQPEFDSHQQVVLLSPMDPPRRIVQEITARRGNKQFTLLCVLELDKKHIAMAGISKAGVSLFNLNYDGKKINFHTSPLLPDHLPPEAVVKDLQLAFWPEAMLQKAYPKPWRLLVGNNRRRLYFNGNLISEIDYLLPGKPWPAYTGLNNRRYGYRLTIKTLSYETLPE